MNLTESEPIQAETILAMLAMIQHRGPDGFGVFRDESIAMGNARLSIIDLVGGDQPIGNEDGTLWIVFNGEIYNYIELRPALELRGHHFTTNTDTECILHLYEDYGAECLSQLNGQFAIAIWDQRRQSLFLARDRVGIRPLFYTRVGDQLVFGSEVKALLAYPRVQAEIDPQSLAEFFTYWSPLSPHTIFKGIVELPPGYYLEARQGDIALHRYWTLDFSPDVRKCSDEEYLEEFEDLLVDATRIRLRADVPVGAYLSGGLDSSTITALIRGHTSTRLDTFSIRFADVRYDESQYQRVMVEQLQTDHHEVFCESADIARVFPQVVWHTETPILRTAPAPMFILSQLVHNHQFRVVLTGEGADEFLGGYDIFKEMKVRRFWARQPESMLRPRLFFKLYPDINRMSSSGAFLTGFFKKGLMETQSPYYSHAIRWANTARTRKFLVETEDSSVLADVNPKNLALPDDFSSWSDLCQAQYLEIVTFLSPYLLSSQGDRMAMAHSVEGRYPFLDHRVMEFCSRLPTHLKMPALTEKYLLKLLGIRYLPPSIWQRVKHPYRAPIQQSFFHFGALDYVNGLLSENELKRSGYFDPIRVQGLVKKASNNARLSEVEEMALVGVLSTQLVDQLFIRERRKTATHGASRIRMVEPLQTVSW